MKRALQRRFPKTEMRKKDEPCQTSPSLEDNPPEERVLHQEINVPELQLILENPSGWSTRDLTTVKKIIDAAPDDTLSVIYSRRYAGRWYARGSAQLQNCKKEIRARALKGKGFGLDICASYPSILAGLTTEVVKKRGATCNMDETRAMARDTKAWRAEVAKHLGSRAHNITQRQERCPSTHVWSEF